MAVSKIAQYTGDGIKLPCILQEGNLTYGAKVHGPDGYFDEGVTIQTPIQKNDWVTLDIDAANTYDATGGNPVVKQLTNGALIIGQVITDPDWEAVPVASQTVRATILAGKWYRKATVEFFGIKGIAKAILVGAGAADIVPGVEGTIQIDASATNALANTTGPVSLSCADVASSAVGIISFHYVAKGTATVSVLVGFTGGVATIGT
jgi:hypothetical protein